MQERKQLQEHEPRQPEGTSLESPGTTGANNGRGGQTDRQTDGGIDKQTGRGTIRLTHRQSDPETDRNAGW